MPGSSARWHATAPLPLWSMGRHRDNVDRTPQADGVSKADLLETAAISSKTFDMFRKAARVTGPNHGGLKYIFTIDEVTLLILKAESGKFTERGPAAALAWRTLLVEKGVSLPAAKMPGNRDRSDDEGRAVSREPNR